MIDITFSAPALSLALLLDRVVGDPPWLWSRVPHPVAVIGGVIGVLEKRLNDLELPASARRRRGIFVLLLITGLGGGSGVVLAGLIRMLPISFALEALVVAILLAHKSLRDHVADVARRLDADGLLGGREAVALIVGRDVSVLDEAGVARAAIESAAENFSDAVVAPTLWYLAFGLPGLFIYKIVNTADSMIGHRSPRYEAFGWASARFDDLLNLIPARISAALIAAAAALTGRSGRGAAAAAWRDARRHKSPNAGWPEAAVAGALGLALGGPRRYGDLAVDGAWLNASGRTESRPEDIDATLRLIDGAWAILFALSAVIALATAL